MSFYYPKAILDLATGTADLAIALAKRNPQAHIIGMDTLPFEDNSFDAVTVAFGVRNFENLKQGLSEIHRVLKPNGLAFILEFSMPEKFPVKQVYTLYFKHILPKIGKWVSKDASAYSYLPESVERFPKPLDFLRLLSSAGLTEGTMRHFGHGIATLYSVIKSK